jgi:hypothetical protein
VTRAIPALAILCALVVPANALLCRTRAGALFVRDACKRKETAVDPATLGGPSPSGDTGAKGASTPRLRVVDANGLFVGFASATGDVQLVHAGRVLILEAGTDGFHPGRPVYFEAAGCVGPALMAGPASVMRRSPIHGSVAYYAGAPVTRRTLLSSLEARPAAHCMDGGQTYDAVTGLCCTPTNTIDDAGPASPFDLSAYVPPFRVEVDR